MKIKKRIRVLIADDHDLYLDGLVMLIGSDPQLELAGAAKNGKELMELSEKHAPDIILTDLRMPVVDGITAIRLITERQPAVRIIALSTYDSESLITDALKAGAMGYVIKNAQNGEIIGAIKVVYGGHPYYCNSTSRQLKIAIAKSDVNPYKIAVSQLFTPRETELIRLICQEKTNKEIAAILFMGIRTVEGVRKRIMEKMKVKTVAGLTIYPVKNGLFKPDDLR